MCGLGLELIELGIDFFQLLEQLRLGLEQVLIVTQQDLAFLDLFALKGPDVAVLCAFEIRRDQTSSALLPQGVELVDKLFQIFQSDGISQSSRQSRSRLKS